MKKLLAFCLLVGTISAKDTITFPVYEQPTLYKRSYSYSTSKYEYRHRDWDYKDYDRDDKPYYGGPSVPEPSTYALFAGLFGLAFAVYKKRKK